MRLRTLFYDLIDFLRWGHQDVNRILVIISMLALAACAGNLPFDSSTQLRIVRDNYGVPHIYADDIYGLYYGYGYAAAQDRLFQLEMARRSTQGQVAEVLGADYIAFDTNARQIFSPASIQTQLDALTEKDRDIFAGFAAGFNHWQAEIQRNPSELMPKQFIDFGFEPRMWTAYDVVMIFVGTMANRFGDFNTELDNVQIYQSLVRQHGEQAGAAIFDLLNPRYTDNAPTTIPVQDWSSPVPDVLMKTQAGSPQADTPRGNYLQAALQRDDAFSGPVISGISNCWVLGKDKVSGANAILVNGPQFGWFSPAYVYSFGMHGAGINVVGNTPFAYPMVMFGHSASIAWGSTWAAGDIVDVYAEQLNPDNAEQYQYKGAYIDFERRQETVQVRDAEPVEIDIRRSVHGPVTSIDPQAGVAYARQRSWDGRELETLLAWVHATWAPDYEQWKVEAEKSSVNVNMYFADTDGNIGYFFGGRYPYRVQGHDNRFPVTGDGSMDWRGRLPVDLANPHVLNPGSGFLANWNNKPGQGVMNPDEYWFSWSVADRGDFLLDTLAASDRFTADEAWAVINASSYVDFHARYLLPLIDKAVTPVDDASLKAANLILQAWDSQSRDNDQDGAYDGAATAIFRTFVTQLIETVLADDLGAVFPRFAYAGYPAPGAPSMAGTNIQTGMKAVIESLAGRGGYDLLNGESADQVISVALKKAVLRLQAAQGTEMEAWRLAVAERPFGTRNFLGVPQAGEDQSLLMPVEQNRGTENNMVVMRKDRIVAWEVAPPGQNAFISPAGVKGEHFDDQFELYYRFGKKRIWFYADDIEANKRSEKVITYAR